MTFVKDTVRGFMMNAVCDLTIGKVINVGYGAGYSIEEIAIRILDLMNMNGKALVSDNDRVRPPKSEVFKLVCDNMLARNIMGWTPKHTLGDGLLRTIEFVSDNIAMFNADMYAK
jgi:dTDP-glucose 4,6-dehydratase